MLFSREIQHTVLSHRKLLPRIQGVTWVLYCVYIGQHAHFLCACDCVQPPLGELHGHGLYSYSSLDLMSTCDCNTLFQYHSCVVIGHEATLQVYIADSLHGFVAIFVPHSCNVKSRYNVSIASALPLLFSFLFCMCKYYT